MVIDSIFVYHFVDPDLKVEVIFRKEGTAENGGTDFEIGDKNRNVHVCTLVLEVEENSF